MRRQKKEKTTGSKGFEPSMIQGLARCGWRGGAGASSPSPSDCNRDDRREGTGVVTSLVGDCNQIGAWNVLSLNQPGKLANVLKEMKRMGVGIMGVAETFWAKDWSFQTQHPESEGGDKYCVFYSGGKKRRRGVGVILWEEVVKSVMMWEQISKRIMIMRLKVAPINFLIV